MWPSRRNALERIDKILEDFSNNKVHLPGIVDPVARNTLALQMIASIRRIDYTKILMERGVSENRTDPNHPMFDPELAAIFYAKANNLDEAFWLVFLSVHFGKHLTLEWQMLRNVYSGLGTKTWTWEEVSSNPSKFLSWLQKNYNKIEWGFGNHRKYETLRPSSEKSTSRVIMSYLDWVGEKKSHDYLVKSIVRKGGNDPHGIFDEFYRSMKVFHFGRLAKFDFLALVGRIDLAPIRPGTPYLKGATGPLKGARLLFTGNRLSKVKPNELEAVLQDLDAELDVGMQVIEDSLCNWQKSPAKFKRFLG